MIFQAARCAGYGEIIAEVAESESKDIFGKSLGKVSSLFKYRLSTGTHGHFFRL
jgi:hypothetical protein